MQQHAVFKMMVQASIVKIDRSDRRRLPVAECLLLVDKSGVYS